MISPKAKEYIKKMYLSRNDINALEQKKSENNFFCEGKKWEKIDFKSFIQVPRELLERDEYKTLTGDFYLD